MPAAASSATCYLNGGPPSSCDCINIQQHADFEELWEADCTVPPGGPQYHCLSFTPVPVTWTCEDRATAQKVYESQPICSAGGALLGADLGGGYAISTVYADTSQNGVDCATADGNLAPGYLAVDLQYDFWNGSSWQTLADSGWNYNSFTESEWGISASFGSYPPAGPGWYATNTGAFAWDGSWLGGWVYTELLLGFGAAPIQGGTPPPPPPLPKKRPDRKPRP